MGRALALVVGPLLVVLLVGLSIYGASRMVAVDGVTALHAGHGRVYIGLGREVFVTDEAGNFVGRLLDRDGEPYAFPDVVNNLYTDHDGNVVAALVRANEILRFGPDLRFVERIHVQDPIPYSYELVPFGEGYALGSTMGHRLKLLDRQGRTVASRFFRYPNGLGVLPLETAGAKEDLLVFAATGEKLGVALDAKLGAVQLATVDTLNRLLEKDEWRHQSALTLDGKKDLSDVDIAPNGVLVAAVCRTTSGDCSVVRVDPVQSEFGVVGDLNVVRDGTGEDTEDLLLIMKLTQTSSGQVLAASPRLTGVFSFAGDGGGAPPPGFCSRCGDRELENLGVTFASVERGVRFPNGTRLALFGDAKVRARFESVRATRRLYGNLERVGRFGTIAIALLLLVGLVVLRQSGAGGTAELSARLEALWRNVIAPDLVLLATCFAPAGLVAALGGALGYALLSTPGLLAFAAVSGGLVARRFSAPMLARGRSPERVAAVVAHHLGAASPRKLPLRLGEEVRWSCACIRVRKPKALEAFDALTADDPLELLEQLTPRLTLLVRTDERLFFVNTNWLGAPVDGIASADVTGELPSEPGTLVAVSDGEVRAWSVPVLPPSAPKEELLLRTTTPAWHCQVCAKPLGTCAHERPALAASLGLTALCPGLGHLTQLRYGRARSLIVVALGFLLTFGHALLPQLTGVLPWYPSEWEPALAGYLTVMAFAAIDVVLHARRFERRRAQRPRVSVSPAL